MKKTLVLIMIFISKFSFAVDMIESDGSSQIFENNGIIVTMSEKTSEYMYIRGLEKNGIHDRYINGSETYTSTQVKYGEFLCRKNVSISVINWNSVKYNCIFAVTDSEI